MFKPWAQCSYTHQHSSCTLKGVWTLDHLLTKLLVQVNIGNAIFVTCNIISSDAQESLKLAQHRAPLWCLDKFGTQYFFLDIGTSGCVCRRSLLWKKTVTSNAQSGVELNGHVLVSLVMLLRDKIPNGRVSNVKMQSQHFLVMTVHNCWYTKDKN